MIALAAARERVKYSQLLDTSITATLETLVIALAAAREQNTASCSTRLLQPAAQGGKYYSHFRDFFNECTHVHG